CARRATRARPAAGAPRRAPTRGTRPRSSVAESEELRAHTSPLTFDPVDATEHCLEIVRSGRCLGLLADGCELSGSERPAVALERVRRPPCARCVARGCGLAEQFEL